MRRINQTYDRFLTTLTMLDVHPIHHQFDRHNFPIHSLMSAIIEQSTNYYKYSLQDFQFQFHSSTKIFEHVLVLKTFHMVIQEDHQLVHDIPYYSVWIIPDRREIDLFDKNS